MNDARMTLRLPGEYLEFARNYASEREMTLTDLVIGYFKKLKEREGNGRDYSRG